MDEPDLAFKLLTTSDVGEAEGLAAQLEKLNASRKGVVGGIVKQARRSVQERFTPQERVVVLGNPEWKPALLGLAANSIMGDRGGIVCLWGRDSNGNLKGSCRSDGVSLVELFANAGDVFEECGGHAHSGGFSVSHEQVHHLPEALARSFGTLPPSPEISAPGHDHVLALSEISQSLYRELSMLAPFGAGNPKPLLRISGIVLTEVRRFGKESNHVEVMLEDKRTGSRSRAFQFFKSPQDFSLAPTAGLEAAMLCTVERDTFRGGLALRIVDIVSPA